MSNEDRVTSPLLHCLDAADQKNGGSVINDSTGEPYAEIQEDQRIHEHATT